MALMVFLSSRISPFTSTGDLPRQVAARDRGRNLGDVAHLTGQVRRHRVHVVGQIFPGAGHAGHFGLAAELAFGTDLARDAAHFGSEAVQLVDHRVDGVFERENLAFDVDGDFPRQVAARDGRRYLCDVAHLAGQVRRHRIHVVGEVLPHPGDVLDRGLAAELAVTADLACHARHLRGEAVQLIDHRV